MTDFVKRICNKDELIEMLKKQGVPMVKDKTNKVLYTIFEVADRFIALSNRTLDYENLCLYYTLIDDSELWKYH